MSIANVESILHANSLYHCAIGACDRRHVQLLEQLHWFKNE